jgi:hypothetical protein
MPKQYVDEDSDEISKRRKNKSPKPARRVESSKLPVQATLPVIKYRMYSLVGDQPVPVLLPLWQNSDHYDSVCFVGTEETKRKNILNNLEKTVRESGQLRHIKMDHLIVDAYDIDSINEALSKEIRENGNKKSVINLTGGTKPMSIAATITAANLHIPFLYVSTKLDRIIYHRSSGYEDHRELIQINITVEEYLRAFGFEVNDANDHTKIYPELTDAIVSALQSCNQFDDIRSNIILQRTEQNPQYLNLAMTRKGVLFIVRTIREDADVVKDDLYTIEAIAQMTGIYCRKLFVTTSTLVATDYTRASNNNICVYYVYNYRDFITNPANYGDKIIDLLNKKQPGI